MPKGVEDFPFDVIIRPFILFLLQVVVKLTQN